MRRDHSPDHEGDEFLIYKRPSIAAWAAVLSAAAALFVLGLYVRERRIYDLKSQDTQKQLEELRLTVKTIEQQVIDASRKADVIQENAPATTPRPQNYPVAPANGQQSGIVAAPPPSPSPSNNQTPTALQDQSAAPPLPMDIRPSQGPSVPAASATAITHSESVPKAQRKREIEVVSLQNKQVLVSGGQQDGRKIGEQLLVLRAGKTIAKLEVIYINLASAGCKIIDAAEMPRVGDEVKLE